MQGAGGPPLLELRIARKAYRGRSGQELEAVRDLSLDIGQGEFLALIGPSGCGKTTVLRIMLGLDRAYEGSMWPDPAALAPGIAFQEPRLLPWRTVEENVRLALPHRLRGTDLGPLFRALGLADWRDRHPGELSLGLARRASLARALAANPPLLLLDEPFVSLDAASAQALRAALLVLFEERGQSVVMVTHDLREAIAMADRLVLLTPRPAHVRSEVVVSAPRKARDEAFIEAERRRILALDPSLAG
jgi:ABC-type nitrate/sulfonate/bicarbonate transport system ATPase subunit